VLANALKVMAVDEVGHNSDSAWSEMNVAPHQLRRDLAGAAGFLRYLWTGSGCTVEAYKCHSSPILFTYCERDDGVPND
jgi:hypothetical protein